MKESSQLVSAHAVLSATAPSTAACALLLIQDAMRLGQLDLGLELVELSKSNWPDEPGIDLVEVM
ncbi:MAG TPA: hypothetical protein VIV60_16760, partial [Polyangiaceae bacterium]